ncbi:MAG: hypothetical protein R2875_16565 [Desulfobacterales bacterium]
MPRSFPRAFSKEDYSKSSRYQRRPLCGFSAHGSPGRAARARRHYHRVNPDRLPGHGTFALCIRSFENNEAIITQRRILEKRVSQKHYPEIKDGFLTLTGSVAIKGIDIALPAIRRLNIARIPGLENTNSIFPHDPGGWKSCKKPPAQRIVVDKQSETLSFE